MDKILLHIHRSISWLNDRLGAATAWLTAVLVLLVGIDVVYRRLLQDTQTWIMEMEWHLFALIFLLGAGFAFRHDKHVRVDLFYAKFSKKNKAWVNLIGGLVFLLPWCIALMIFSWEYTADAFRIREASPDPGGLPARYIIKFSIVLGAFFLFLQGIASVAESILHLKGIATETDAPEIPESI